MKNSIEGYGTLIFGKMQFFNDDVFKQSIKDLYNCPFFSWKMEWGNKRTVQQNAYLFGGIIAPLVLRYNQEGEPLTKDDAYRILSKHVGTREVTDFVTGEITNEPIDIKNIGTDEFMDKCYEMREIIHGIEGLDLYIQLPHEYYGMTLQNYDLWKAGKLSFSEAVKREVKSS